MYSFEYISYPFLTKYLFFTISLFQNLLRELYHIYSPMLNNEIRFIRMNQDNGFITNKQAEIQIKVRKDLLQRRVDVEVNRKLHEESMFQISTLKVREEKVVKSALSDGKSIDEALTQTIVVNDYELPTLEKI